MWLLFHSFQDGVDRCVELGRGHSCWARALSAAATIILSGCGGVGDVPWLAISSASASQALWARAVISLGTWPVGYPAVGRPLICVQR